MTALRASFHVSKSSKHLEISTDYLVVSLNIATVQFLEDTPLLKRIIINNTNEIIVDYREQCGDSGDEEVEGMVACTLKTSTGVTVNFVTANHETAVGHLRLF